MLKEKENVTVFNKNKEYNGTVLGVEGDEFWLLVLDLNEVQRGHVLNLHQLPDGKKFLSAAEWVTGVETLFDKEGNFISNVFWASKDPKSMIGQLKMQLLLGMFKLNDR
jgi:hypothetical protein